MDKILDIIRGQGTTTADLAALVPQGSIVGGEVVEIVLTQAAHVAKSKCLTNLTF